MAYGKGFQVSSGFHQYHFFDDPVMNILMTVIFLLLMSYKVFIKIINTIELQHLIFFDGIKPTSSVVFIYPPSLPILYCRQALNTRIKSYNNQVMGIAQLRVQKLLAMAVSALD